MLRLGWFLVFCLLPTAARGGQSGAAAVVQQFYAHLSGGDVARAGELWTAAQRPGFERRSARIAAVRCMRIESLLLQETGSGAELFIDADATIAEWHIGAATERLVRRQSRFRLRREGDTWRIEEWLEKEQRLADEIKDAETDAARTALLHDHASLAGVELGGALTKRAIRLVNEGRIERAAAVNAMARRIAEDHLDDGLLSRVLGVESVLARAPQPPDAVAAVALAEESARLAEASGDPDALQHALLRLIRARRAATLGAEIDLFPKALELAERVEDLATAAQLATAAAWYHDDRREHRQAMVHALRAERLAEASGDAAARLGAQMNLGGTYHYRLDHALAEKHYERALAIAREAKFPQSVSGVLSRLAATRMQLEDGQRALPLLDELLQLGTADDSPLDFGRALLQRGQLAIQRGNFAAAEADLTPALAAAERAQEPVLLHDVRETLGALRFLQGRHEEALNLTQSWPLKAMALIALGRYAEAEDAARAAIRDFERWRGDIAFDPRQIRQLLRDVTPAWNVLVELLVDCGRAEEALQELERRKSGLLRNVLTQAGTADLSPLTPAEHKRLQELEERLVQLNRGTPARNEIVLTRLELSDFWTRMHALHPELQWPGTAPSPFADLVPASPDVVYASYAVLEEKTILFAVSHDERGARTIRTVQIPIAIGELRTRVRRFARQLETRDLGFAASARALYDLLLRPIERELFRPGRRICIIPDDELWRLPFHALKPSQKSFVAGRASLFYAPSMSVDQTLRAHDAGLRRGEPRLLAFGNPAAAGASDALPEAEAEVRRIAGLYPKGSGVHLNGRADEATFKANAAGYGVVHIAAHAQLDDAPMYSAVLLSGSAAEDGRLEAREIAALRIDARLVVISACESARGDWTGEGVVGLPWALLATGARSSVVSLWPVDSTATAQLMEELHRRLLASDFASVSDALRAAQLSLLESDRYSHPYYWAPFVAIGAD